MRVCCWVEWRGGGKEVEHVVSGEEEGDDEGLGDFDAVYACEDIDAVWCEDCDCSHVEVVRPS